MVSQVCQCPIEDAELRILWIQHDRIDVRFSDRLGWQDFWICEGGQIALEDGLVIVQCVRIFAHRVSLRIVAPREIKIVRQELLAVGPWRGGVG